MSNTIRSVVFSSPFDFNHKLNRLSFLGAYIIVFIAFGIVIVSMALVENHFVIFAGCVAVLGLFVLQCKVMYARFSEFITNKATIVQAIVGVQGLSFVGEFLDSPEILLLARIVGFIVFIFLLFTPATTKEETVAVA